MPSLLLLEIKRVRLNLMARFRNDPITDQANLTLLIPCCHQLNMALNNPGDSGTSIFQKCNQRQGLRCPWVRAAFSLVTPALSVSW